jgi:hypothetical protein
MSHFVRTCEGQDCSARCRYIPRRILINMQASTMGYYLNVTGNFVIYLYFVKGCFE